jgi:hypothetical protein
LTSRFHVAWMKAARTTRIMGANDMRPPGAVAAQG